MGMTVNNIPEEIKTLFSAEGGNEAALEATELQLRWDLYSSNIYSNTLYKPDNNKEYIIIQVIILRLWREKFRVGFFGKVSMMFFSISSLKS